MPPKVERVGGTICALVDYRENKTKRSSSTNAGNTSRTGLMAVAFYSGFMSRSR